MADFSFLDDHPPVQRNSNRQQHQQQGAGTPAAAAAGGNAAAGTTAGSTQQQQQPRVRIQLPSFKQVQAAEAPSRPVITFQPGTASSSPQQQQQQPQQQQPQQQQVPAWLQQGSRQQQQQQQQPPNWQQQRQQQQSQIPGSAGINAPSGQAAAAAGQASWLASLPPMTLHTQLPRFSQGAGGASTGAAVGISRPTVPLLQASAAAQQHGQQQAAPAAAAGSAGSAQQQQQQMALNAVLVSRRQQGNPVLKHIKAVRWVFADIVPDYLCGQNTAVLFLSLRYHLLQPEYVLSRLQSLQRGYRLCVLLLLVDAEEVVKPLLELHRATLGAQAVLVCAWSNEECARYIETFKAYENKPASSIMKHTDTDYMGRLAAALTTIRGVNRSDAYSLAKHFGSLADVFMCNDVEGFARIPGLGPLKAKRLLDTFNQPFRRNLTAAANTAAAAAPGAAAAAAASAAAAGGGGGGGGSVTSASAATGAAPQQQQATPGGGVSEPGGTADSAAEDTAAGGPEVHGEEDIDLELDWEAEGEGGLDGGAGAGEDDGAEQEEWDDEGWEGEQDEELGAEELPGAMGGYHEDYLDVLDDVLDAEDF